MVSRVDRLFILLDTGSSESVRLAAAKQLGEVQRAQPNDLDYLLRRIKEYSSKPIWETRVAAGHATRYVLEQVQAPQQDVKSDKLSEDEKLECSRQLIHDFVNQHVDIEKILASFKIDELISLGLKFLSLDVNDVDTVQQHQNPSSSKSTATKSSKTTRGRKGSTSSRSQTKKQDTEHLLRQRKLINKELGIAMVDSLNLGVRSTDIVSNDDLQNEYECSSTPKSNLDQIDSRAVLQTRLSNYDKLIRNLSDHSSLPENITGFIQAYQWPLQDITKQYTEDMFSPSWEHRHGAAIALREIVRLQGKFAGRLNFLSDNCNEKLNQLWLVDMALRAISLLALDKFGDFLFDQVIAPVRENGAQLLGCCVSLMTEHHASLTINILLKMLSNPNWETRHGSILGLKYSLNVLDKSFSKKMLQICFDPIIKCLADPADDVSAEAAAALVPVKNLMIEAIPERTPELIRFLWDHLADLDELTTSTSNIVLLLASLITSNCAQLEISELTKSIPKLWSLLSHPSTSVRSSVLRALITLVKAQQRNCLSWMSEDLITIAFRLIYQRSILENMDEVRKLIEEVWMILIRVDNTCPSISNTERFTLLKCTSQYLNYWLCLIMQPSSVPIDRGSPLWLNLGPDGSISTSKPDGEVYISSCTFNAESINQQKLQITKCRMQATKLIGALYAHLTNEFSDSLESQHYKDTLKYLSDMFVHYIETKSANQRLISGWALESWAVYEGELLRQGQPQLKDILSDNLIKQMDIALRDTLICYDELASTYTRLQQETRDFVTALQKAGIDSSSCPNSDKKIFYNLSQIQNLCDLNIQVELTRIASKRSPSSISSGLSARDDQSKLEDLLVKKTNLTKSLTSTKLSQKSLSITVLSSLSCAHISWQILPSKLELLSEPLLDSIELEPDPTLQEKSADYLVILINILLKGQSQSRELMDLILDRLINTLDSGQTSSYLLDTAFKTKTPLGLDPLGRECSIRIVLLDNLRRKAERVLPSSRRQSSISNPLKRSLSSVSETCENESNAQLSDTSFADLEALNVKLEGVSCALNKLVRQYGNELPDKLPKLWSAITHDIVNSEFLTSAEARDEQDASSSESELIRSLRLLESIGESLSRELLHNVLSLMPHLIKLLSSRSPLVRYHSSQCIGVISKLMFPQAIDLIKERIIPMLDLTTDTIARCGAIEAIASIIEQLNLELVPYTNMFIIHVLRRMSDQDNQARLMATHCFGKLLSLMPLNIEKSDSGTLSATDGSESRQESNGRNDQGRFIEQLLNPKRLETFSVPFKMRVELRSYQQDGLNWLAFMNKFNLHGILCDEMGLGKTFMTICMVASDHYNSKMKGSECPPSLIVCPSTLTEHWLYELNKFLAEDVSNLLEPIAYSGSVNDRTNLRARIAASASLSSNGSVGEDGLSGKIGLIVASYDIVRNDIDFFKDIHWNYCVLDEGHIIKNGKTKLSRSIRLLKAQHRLILSGTPIQNNVTELWSLFDFLMPGFLGSERQFNSRYAKPILQSREIKSSARELEAGALAMESLHRQVLPFILRRLKEDVLDDLPPKIIQDYYCELSPLQYKLYEDFTKSKLCNEVTKNSVRKLDALGLNKSVTDGEELFSSSRDHVFQALQYLKNVCNHPKLVLSEKHSHYKEIKKNLLAEKSSLKDITHSSKLKALKQLLLDCGIGTGTHSGEEAQLTSNLPLECSVVNQHRALVFCQARSMIGIIEEDLLKVHLPTVTYLKLDGSVPVNQRHSVVSRFNNDPSIDILLLTTQIGGLGLNLTGADTVIFVEHDWNPTKDLQAMDRAHRIGQKKVVNVYRLITKGTLEEKIMGLQKFKTMVSNTVINQDNTGLSTMGVDQLLDLFEIESGQGVKDNKKLSPGDKPTELSIGKTNFSDMLPELWDQQQYENEYDLSNFVSSLKN